MELRELIDRAIEYDNEHRKTPLEHGNLFSVLGMEHKEVSAHSAFLYFVFKPFKDHDGNIDDYNLRELMRVLRRGAVKNYRRLDIRREVSSLFGRMDFVIAADDEVFVIELKIWAGEQSYQLERYENYLASRGADKANVFFLTPSARNAKTSDTAVNITLQGDIKPVLITIANSRRAQHYERYATMIEQYVSIIDKLTIGENSVNEQLNILQSKEDLLAVDCLIENRKARLTQLILKFFAELKVRLGDELTASDGPSAKLIEYPYGEKSMRNYYSEKCWPALIYEIDDFPLVDSCKLTFGYKLYFFVEISENLYCGISPRADEGDKQNNVKNGTVFVDGKLPSVGDVKHTDIYTVWEHVKSDGNEINFTVKKLQERNSFVNLLEAGALEFSHDLMDGIAADIKTLYNKFCRVLFSVREGEPN